jgi:hypothetical protein
MDEQRPGDGAPASDDGGHAPFDGGPDGPPPPPPPPVPPTGVPPAVALGATPATRRRPRWPLIVALVAVVIGVPVAMVVLGGPSDDEGSVAAPDDERDAGDADDPDDPSAPGDDPDDPDENGGAPGGVAPDTELEPLDLDALTGLDRTYGQLLTDIDASERTMIDFQAGLADVFSGGATPEEALDDAVAVAAESRESLLGARDRLTTTLDEPGADRVRELYVAHLDAWEGFMAAVEADPLAAFEQGESGATVRINATADAFARSLEAELPDDIDAEVARFADELLDRGFRDMGYSDV